MSLFCNQQTVVSKSGKGSRCLIDTHTPEGIHTRAPSIGEDLLFRLKLFDIEQFTVGRPRRDFPSPRIHRDAPATLSLVWALFDSPLVELISHQNPCIKALSVHPRDTVSASISGDLRLPCHAPMIAKATGWPRRPPLALICSKATFRSVSIIPGLLRLPTNCGFKR